MFQLLAGRSDFLVQEIQISISYPVLYRIELEYFSSVPSYAERVSKHCYGLELLCTGSIEKEKMKTI